MKTAHLLADLLSQRSINVRICTANTSISDLGLADTIVFTGDGFPTLHGTCRAPMAEWMMKMLDNGAGIVCNHFAIGVQESETISGAHPLLELVGGYFAVRGAQNGSGNIFAKLTVIPNKNSPLAHDCEPFELEDELYYDILYNTSRNNGLLAPIAHATTTSCNDPPVSELVAWSYIRPGGGRGFVTTLPHFFKNWSDTNLQRLVINGILWTANLDIR
jgi:type 1 glutamine amidotransferase